ncbi:nucleoside-diphosphate kinase [Marchantia polymorpha subsp. ruderalis]|uniref:Nucleoside diphosphate kinase n=2 Tax=Marchantia polymorpha TaxID=3197 RepID=A0AAF6B4F1_MARPO|nr:hypothetical protein MARPO_0224s0010 [Marchantia polymorpha]BBN06885.1 hypothetical protein Mp_3g24660 [Marchantia polymorpha subsp. ruderalis]|eukprot:PTQ27095.1 hypothetical protein MARPO_0224s0010 [Marchantia polymorpha]
MWKLRTALLVAVIALVTPSHCAIERTLGMIKPDCVRNKHVDEIRKIILAQGFSFVKEKDTKLDVASAKSFYQEHNGKEFFPSLIEFMTSGPVHPMVLEGEGAIKKWRALMGPTDSNKARITAPDSIRAAFGTDNQMNCVHGSDAPESAAREISFFFGDDKQGSWSYLSI